MRTENPEHVAETLDVALDLLQGDDVEARHDLGDDAQRPQIALGAVVVSSVPLLCQIPEGADVPGGDQKIVVETLGRDGVVERRANAS